MFREHLVHLCLNTIAENFQRYNLVFSTTEDASMKRKFEFLQRKYSLELLERLCLRNALSADYIDLLINKYLKVLDTIWFKQSSWDKFTSKIAEIGNNVESITFKDVYFEEFCEETPWQDIICHLPNLKSFTFHDDCNDLILKNVAKFCPNIEEIDIEDSEVTFEGVKYLCKDENGKPLCTKLKKLCMADTHIKDDGVKYLLKNLPSLEFIDYPDLPLVLHSLHKSDLSSLDKVEPYKIAALDLMNFAPLDFFADILKVCLYVCRHLKSLTCGLVYTGELDFFSILSDLERLYIKSFLYSDININDLLKSKGEKLTSLAIENCTVSISILAKSCPRVKELTVINVRWIIDEEDSTPVFNSLSSITFENSNISSVSSVVGLLLSSSEKLESLSVEKCKGLLTDEIKAYVFECCQRCPIKKVSFFMSAVEKEYVKKILLNCHTLNYLSIDSCFIKSDEIELIKFAAALPNKPKIDAGEHLDIRNLAIGSQFFWITPGSERDFFL